MKLLIANGKLVRPQKSEYADIMIEGSKILAIGKNLPTEDCTIYDAAGCLIFAGFIDAHTHLDLETKTEKTADDFHSGTCAALAGGTTCIIDFATQNKGESLLHALDIWHKKAQDISSCHYAFHMAITDWNEKTTAEIGDMVQAGVTSFKLYMAYDALRVSDGELYAILQSVGKVGGIVGVHCESGDLINAMIAENLAVGNTDPQYHPLSRPDYLEAEAIARCCYIAKAAGVAINIVHLSSALGLEEAYRARARGQKVYIETCPQYFILDDSVYKLPDFESLKYVCSPPLRKKNDQNSLWKALTANEIDTICTDHCSFRWKDQKMQGKDDFSKIPNGIPGIEHRASLMFTMGVTQGKMTENQMAAMLSENAARLFGMYPQKGALEAGADADIVVWDPSYQGTITAMDMYQNVDYTPYEGIAITGRAKAVFLNGEQVVADGCVQKKHRGQYIVRGKSEYY